MKFVDTLREAGVPEAQAKAEAKAVNEAIASAVDMTLATKNDINLVRSDIAASKLDMIKWIVVLIVGQTALLITILPKIIGH
jgi:hypothetical protein